MSNNLPTTPNKPVERRKRASIDFKFLAATFAAAQDVKSSSRNLYEKTLSLFFGWVIRTDRDIEKLTRLDILAYKEELLAAGKSNLTVASYIVVVRKFYEWAEASMMFPNIAKGVKTPRRKQSFKKEHLTDEQSSKLLDYFRGTPSTHKKNPSILVDRDFAIINLMLRTGLRTIEVIRANIGDIKVKNGERVLMVWGKGKDSKEDFVVLTDKAYLPIKDYLAERGQPLAGEPLFTSWSQRNRGHRLTTRTIRAICKSGLVAIGLDSREYTAHCLRHTTACALLNHGVQLMNVQWIMRHSNPATTEIYLESLREEKRIIDAPERVLDNAF